jgi:predicted ArsR family transcriptional regulator
MHVDNWDPETYKWILEEVDIPYIKEEWDKLLEKFGKNPEKLTGTTIVGRYLSKMKLRQWKDYSWADTERLEEEYLERKISAMKAQGFSGEEIN